ncbi:MAG: helix-turn-helix domain-containing protein [Bdellovibrionales bacterium]
MEIGEIVKYYRIKTGMTQLELAQRLGYKIPQFISLIENGHSKVPLNIIADLSAILKIPENLLLDLLLSAYEKEARKFLSKKSKIRS